MLWHLDPPSGEPPLGARCLDPLLGEHARGERGEHTPGPRLDPPRGRGRLHHWGAPLPLLMGGQGEEREGCRALLAMGERERKGRRGGEGVVGRREGIMS